MRNSIAMEMSVYNEFGERQEEPYEVADKEINTPVIHYEFINLNGGNESNLNYECVDVNGESEGDDLRGELPLNPIKNVTSKVKNRKKVRKKEKESILQKENLSESDSDEEHITVTKRYGLRNRKRVSLKEDDFDYFNTDDEDSRLSTTEKINKCSRSHQNFMDKTELKHHQENGTNFQCTLCGREHCSQQDLDEHECSNKVYKKHKKKDLICGECEEVFSDVEGLKHHSRVHCQTCSKCNKVFNGEDSFNSHECRGLHLFTCDICKKTYSRFHLLQKHIASHMKRFLSCQNCFVKFETSGLLEEHLSSSECGRFLQSPRAGVNKCELCRKTFPQLGKLKIHLLRHQGIRYKCRKCNKSFVSRESLEQHGLSVDCSLTVRRCEQCGKVYRDNFNFKKHLLSHKDDVLRCNVCKIVFVEKTKLKEHINANSCREARRSFKYECDACGQTFVRLAKLQIHILNVHHGINYQCDTCGVKFASEADREAHVQADCKPEAPCSCSICGKIFAKRDYLKKHVYLHNNVLYKCKFCYCAFIKEKSFNKHMDRMNCSKSARSLKLAEFNFRKCRVCEMEFESEDCLIEHFGKTHPGSEPHLCFCCETTLPSSRELESHIHHHNVQKFTCRLCGKPYTSQEGFRKHRLKHKGAELKCRHCEAQFLNERRFRLHERTCKKNPELGYDPSKDKPKPKKDGRPKQSRQLNWESRIIMKRLRADPNKEGDPMVPPMGVLFEDRDSDSKTSGERGWFDNYYKTELDDAAFGVAKESVNTSLDYDSDFDVTEFLQSGSIVKVRKPSPVPPPESVSDHDVPEADSPTLTSDSSEEEDIEEELPVAYNPKNCRVCNVNFAQEYELLHHFIKTHPGQFAHKCPNCIAEFPLFAQLKEHMKEHGIGMGVFNCDNCSKKFKSEKKMKNHNYRCKGMEAEIKVPSSDQKITVQLKLDNEDYCKYCCKRFQTKCGYRRHKVSCKERRKVNKEERVKKVTESVKSVAVTEKSDDEDWRNQEDSMEPDLEESQEEERKKAEGGNKEEFKDTLPAEPPMDSFPCRLCEKKFQYERGVVMHFKTSHPGHKPLVCHICNLHLADKLKEHLKTHGIGEEFVCELCGKRFNQKFLSKIHEMWHQGVEFKCANCKQKFLNKQKMDKHIAEGRCSKRQSLMRLPCDICGKSYRSKFGLSKHYITHTPKELRPIKNRMNCEFCGKWFENNNGLQRHRRIHTGERPYCCRYCPKSFAQEGNCKAHERIHTGETKPRKKKALGDYAPVEYPPVEFVYNPGNAPGMQVGVMGLDHDMLPK